MARKKAAKPDLHREAMLVPTPDEWCPSLDANGECKRNGGFVRLSLLELRTGEWRVCLWGGDDLGRERDFEPGDRGTARAYYDLLAGGGPVSFNDLEALGFVPA